MAYTLLGEEGEMAEVDATLKSGRRIAGDEVKGAVISCIPFGLLLPS
jgi:hypothetical protein